MQLRLHAVDHLQGVLSLPHDDNAGNDFAISIQVGDSAAQIGTKDHLPNVLYANRRTGIAGDQDNVLKVLNGFGIAAAAHHILSAAELQQAAAGFAVAAANSLDHAVDGNSVSLQTAGIDIDLKLLRIAAKRRDFRDARNRLQIVAHVPVLEGAQLCQIMAAGLIDQRILKD